MAIPEWRNRTRYSLIPTENIVSLVRNTGQHTLEQSVFIDVMNKFEFVPRSAS